MAPLVIADLKCVCAPGFPSEIGELVKKNVEKNQVTFTEIIAKKM